MVLVGRPTLSSQCPCREKHSLEQIRAGLSSAVAVESGGGRWGRCNWVGAGDGWIWSWEGGQNSGTGAHCILFILLSPIC